MNLIECQLEHHIEYKVSYNSHEVAVILCNNDYLTLRAPWLKKL